MDKLFYHYSLQDTKDLSVCRDKGKEVIYLQ